MSTTVDSATCAPHEQRPRPCGPLKIGHAGRVGEVSVKTALGTARGSLLRELLVVFGTGWRAIGGGICRRSRRRSADGAQSLAIVFGVPSIQAGTAGDIVALVFVAGVEVLPSLQRAVRVKPGRFTASAR